MLTYTSACFSHSFPSACLALRCYEFNNASASQCQEETNSHLWKTLDLQHELVDKIFSGKDMSLFQSLVVDTLSGSSNEQACPPRSWHV
ncbi:hypothetical protein MRB53_004388 [Persea americana]|uniref:Uncharacterized protein n=1 Tax=Persea americana TaxID=3435 RepID=A0ACC2MAF0_PERAE|nr:hypothetical protein MRB53_004388 [Persea americana]